MDDPQKIRSLTDSQLAHHVEGLTSCEQAAVANLIVGLAELDRRRLFLVLGFNSMFAYCTEYLHFSEAEAYYRIEAARVSLRFPLVLEMLEVGALTLTAIRLLGPHLTDQNHLQVLESARHKKREEIQAIIASLRPQPPVPAIIRKLPEKGTVHHRDDVPGPDTIPVPVPPSRFVAHPEGAGDELPQTAATRSAATGVIDPPLPARRPALEPLSESHYKLQVTISKTARDWLREIQSLMRHTIPNGDPAAIVERSFEVLLAELKRRKCALVDRPRPEPRLKPRGRHIPAAVKRRVWERDGGRCAFTTPDGVRCSDDAFLEYHHVKPYARGGEATVDNIEMRCRAHNAYEADLAGLRR